MDFCPNPSISLSKKQEDIFTTLNDQHPPPKHENGGLSQLLSQKTNEGDENSEWLSVFVEECFSSSGNYILAPVNEQMITRTSTSDPIETRKPHQLQNPTKKKRKKAGRSISKLKTDKFPSIFDLEHLITELIPDPDPPLLHQAHWLADSEPIFPIKHEPVSKKDNSEEKPENVGDDELSPSSDHYYGEPESEKKQKKVSKPRKCSHCQAEKTPLWRQGPLGKGTLCNACGVRWLKSGKLFPEYRPANSPTFVSDLHSNVLRKVLKMREARQGSSDYGS